MAHDHKARALPLRRAFVTAMLALVVLIVSAPVSFAQDPFTDFFGGLFGPQKHSPPPRSMDQPRVRRMMPHQENRPPTYWRSGEATRAPTKRSKRTETAEKPEVAASYFVAVMGDTLGVLLANGLEESFADNPDIGVLRKSKESSGLVRDDFYDWPKAAKEIAGGQQKVDVAVMMIGSNDRQSLRQAGQNEEPFSPRWREAYVARVDAVLAAFREKKIPVVWVGLPVMKNESFSADMSKLNDIFREEVAREGGVYVDLWEALADERGQYSAFGPDINGQIVKLRTADGVHLTDAGALSVAHFVATEIRKLHEARHHPEPEKQAAPDAPASDAATPAGSSATAPAPDSGAPVVFRSPVKPPSLDAPALPERPAVGPVQALSGPPSPGAGGLARRSANPTPADDAQALAKHVFVNGGDPPPRPNRADDYSWKPAAP